MTRRDPRRQADQRPSPFAQPLRTQGLRAGSFRPVAGRIDPVGDDPATAGPETTRPVEIQAGVAVRQQESDSTGFADAQKTRQRQQFCQPIVRTADPPDQACGASGLQGQRRDQVRQVQHAVVEVDRSLAPFPPQLQRGAGELERHGPSRLASGPEEAFLLDRRVLLQPPPVGAAGIERDNADAVSALRQPGGQDSHLRLAASRVEPDDEQFDPHRLIPPRAASGDPHRP